MMLDFFLFGSVDRVSSSAAGFLRADPEAVLLLEVTRVASAPALDCGEGVSWSHHLCLDL